MRWHPEIAAARLLTGVASAADQNGRGAPAFLTALAAADGPAGPAVHLARAYGLASVPEEDRDAAVAELVQLGTLKVPLLTESLRAAAALPGTAPALWPVLARRTPGLLASTRPQAHAALLAVAADAARDGRGRCTPRDHRTRPTSGIAPTPCDMPAGCATSSPHTRHAPTPRK
ncbi:hypothetical protein [Streptomyces sp. NPDC005533]|uniref:hypothetical protein n=1 Tax=Streptomyces sp. NPDC005533 TaxID=3364723 RepID=UPI0036896C36